MWPFRKRQEEQRALTEWPWDEGGSPQPRHINVERALQLVPVFGAARVLADNIAAMPLRLFRERQGVPEMLPLPSLFNQPSVHGTTFDWKHRAVSSMALQGDAIGLVTARDYLGFPTMIEWLNPGHVEVLDGAMAGRGSYMNPIWMWMGREVNPADIVHIPWFCQPYKVRGLSPIGAFRLSANIGLGAQEYASAWFDNGGVPPGTFRNTAQTVSKEDADLITARVTRRLKERKPLVYGADWEYAPIAINPHEAQFVETMRLNATQIAVIYGIPPEKLGGTTGNSLTYATVEQNSVDFLTFSLRPWMVRIEEALSRVFPRGTYVRFDPSGLLRMDAKSKAEVDALTLGYQPRGWRSINEVRAGNDLPPMSMEELPLPAAPAPAPNPASAKPATQRDRWSISPSPNGAKPPVPAGN